MICGRQLISSGLGADERLGYGRQALYVGPIALYGATREGRGPSGILTRDLSAWPAECLGTLNDRASLHVVIHAVTRKSSIKGAEVSENKPVRRAVSVKPWDYEPTEEELNEEFRIDATPDQLARMLGGIRVFEDPEA